MCLLMEDEMRTLVVAGVPRTVLAGGATAPESEGDSSDTIPEEPDSGEFDSEDDEVP